MKIRTVSICNAHACGLVLRIVCASLFFFFLTATFYFKFVPRGVCVLIMEYFVI